MPAVRKMAWMVMLKYLTSQAVVTYYPPPLLHRQQMHTRAHAFAGLIALAALLAGCSAASSKASSGGGTGSPAVQGVATPSSVSVVTAN